MKRGPKKMTEDDRVLWTTVARSVTPLAGKSFAELMAGTAPIEQAEPVSEPAQTLPTLSEPVEKKQKTQSLHRIDAPTRRKLEKGRLPIEGKVDLHGMTQSEAYGLLLSFVQRAYADGRRHVLVVTGKGSSGGSDGILKRIVPSWFQTAMFRPFVSTYEDASRRHGGAGALYVRIRRRAGGDS